MESVQAGVRRTLGSVDALAFVITAVVVLDTIGAVASGGTQAFVWLTVMGLLFLLPSALVTAELSAAFPQEGGHYVWASTAFGRVTGAVSSFFYWVESPIWIGGSLAITTAAVIDQFFVPLGGVRTLGVVLAFVAVTIMLSLLPMSIARFVPMIGAVSRVALLAGFTLAVVGYAVQNGVHTFAFPALGAPSLATFTAVVPVLLYNYLGFDVPATAGDEMRNPQRDLPRAALHGGVWTFVLYAVPVAAVLVLLPEGSVTSLEGFIDAIRTVFTVFGGGVDENGVTTLDGAGLVLGDLAALGFVVVLITSGATWLMGAVRSQSVACRDGAGPAMLGHVGDDGVPRRLVLVSGVVATVTALGVYAITGSDAERYFTAALSLAIATLAISYVAVFAALHRLRVTHPDVPRPYRIPGGHLGAVLAGGSAMLWTLLALGLLVWPPTLPEAFADDRLGFEVASLLPLVMLGAGAALFAISGRRARTYLDSPALVDDRVVVIPAQAGAPSQESDGDAHLPNSHTTTRSTR
jgi:glutamate:GABA antiporter